jgi:hypothetical protein
MCLKFESWGMPNLEFPQMGDVFYGAMLDVNPQAMGKFNRRF